MILKNKINKEKGFTIVELLIVIVVIGILAAITIVAYNGVQSRARTTTAQANAQEAQNKAEVYAADTGNGVYPTLAEIDAATGTAQLSPAVAAMTGAAAPAAGTQATVLHYVKCTTAIGAKVGYWDSAKTSPGVVYLLAGAATDSTTATC
jgi:prepilin-type N-terminal cleavage/methylation domain-containing protein